MIKSAKSFWALKSVIITLVSMRVTMDSFATDIHRYLDYSISWYHICSMVEYVSWLTTISLQETFPWHECMQPYSRPTVDRKLSPVSSLLSKIARTRQKIGFVCAWERTSWTYYRIWTVEIHCYRRPRATTQKTVQLPIHYRDRGKVDFAGPGGAIELHPRCGCRSSIFGTRSSQVWTAKDTGLIQYKIV